MSTPDLLAGRVALVTGGSRGIGWSIASALAGAGARVWVNARREGELSEACRTLTARGAGAAQPVYFDVSDAKGVQTGITDVYRAERRLDILVNNAGVMRGAPIEMASTELIEETLATNLRGVLLCSQYATRLMAKGGGGTMINITSIIGRSGGPGQSVYAASKAGVIGVTLSLAKELAPRQIRVNAIAPGIIDTELLSALPPAKREAAIASVGLGRIGLPEDVAFLAVFLASDQARYITGQVIGVDGGMTI